MFYKKNKGAAFKSSTLNYYSYQELISLLHRQINLGILQDLIDNGGGFGIRLHQRQTRFTDIETNFIERIFHRLRVGNQK